VEDAPLMPKKPYTVQLLDKGMTRDMSVSKAEEGFAYENRNVRILSDRHDTLMSVTSERGNREVQGLSFEGELVGWNVLNDYIILFTADGDDSRIYRVEYSPGEAEGSQFSSVEVYRGGLGFDASHPIESVVDYESEDIQKIYWVDGVHVLRFLNFADKYLDENMGRFTDDWFDTNRASHSTLDVTMERTLDGDPRANGVVQYFVTYYNKNGQETAWVYASPLVYLSPSGRGGSADGQCNAKVTLTLSGLDESFDYVRLYSVETHSLGGTRVAYIVAEAETTGGTATLVDSGKPLSTVDATSLLFLGSRECHAGTMAHKDGTLFLGDIVVDENTDSADIRAALEAAQPYSGDACEASWVEFFLTDSEDENIPLPELEGTYPYISQLQYPNSRITTFKGGEKYRFAVRFRKPSGTTTQAYWIGDKENALYPVMTAEGVRRPLARCTLPDSVVSVATGLGYTTAQLMIAEASYTDRSVLAQGVVSPTMFNVWERYNGGLFSQGSWTYRPRHSSFAWRHYEPVHISTDVSGEIQCNYWDVDNYGEGEAPTPYYRTNADGKIIDPLEGQSDETAIMVMYRIHRYQSQTGCFVRVMRLYADDEASVTPPPLSVALKVIDDDKKLRNLKAVTREVALEDYPGYTLRIDQDHRDRDTEDDMVKWLRTKMSGWGVSDDYIIDDVADYEAMSHQVGHRDVKWFRCDDTSVAYDSVEDAFAAGEGWCDPGGLVNPKSGTNRYMASYYKKHLEFVDESIVTVNSPEIDTEEVVVEDSGLKLRIVGVAKVDGNITDYKADITDQKYIGSPLYQVDLSRQCVSDEPDGLQSWPLAIEYAPNQVDPDDDDAEEASDWYVGGSIPILYWLHMFQKGGGIPGLYGDKDALSTDSGEDSDAGAAQSSTDAKQVSVLNSKTFANLRYCGTTIYADEPVEYDYDYKGVANRVRGYNYTTAQYMNIDTGDGTVAYNANVDMMLTVPGILEYPVLHSVQSAVDSPSAEWEYYVVDPVQLTYRSRAHAVASLGVTDSGATELLPYVFDDERFSPASGGRLPWKTAGGDTDEGSTFATNQRRLEVGGLSDGDRYVLIGEIYKDYGDPSSDTRYGGVTESAVEANTFVAAGAFTALAQGVTLVGDEGDTFFQRWDGVKTVPGGDDDVNQVVDVASVMVETHVNMDGRYDNNRGNTRLAYIDWDAYGLVNDVYTQGDDFVSSAQLDEQGDLDSYRSSVTWTLEKTDGAEVDEWTHVTLASTLKLDGDKGVCRAIRRWNNTLVAFQDRAICEILFNSRTQLTTTDTVPVEIANTGKVDGKRYITNSYGCTNKWSIAEGKSGLYFVDDLNQIIATLGADGIDALSSKAKLDAWVKLRTDEAAGEESWRPDAGGRQFLTQYDRRRSELYFFKWNDEDYPCLVYSEALGAFTSFYDYLDVPMLANVGERLLSFRDGRLWLQNEGLYGDFFGEGHGLSVTYRAVANADATWTNLEYRSDFHRMVDGEGRLTVDVDSIIDGTQGAVDSYVPDETFDTVEAWDEYQRTGEVPVEWRPRLGEAYPDTRKKFRTWRMDIPRAVKDGRNRYGLDRLRNRWIYIKLSKGYADGRDMMHLHDVSATCYLNDGGR